jgi:hypothetical protein
MTRAKVEPTDEGVWMTCSDCGGVTFWWVILISESAEERPRFKSVRGVLSWRSTE